MLTPEQVKNNGWLIFEVVAGSKAYGLNTTTSDTDIRGVFVLPRERLYGMNYTGQVNNETNDIVYYELRRFMELLAKNNPNILELLSISYEHILLKHPVMELIQQDLFLSKLCEKTFANYAHTQIKKAFGLEKKIVNPVEKEKKSVLNFCFVYTEKEAVPLLVYLPANGLQQDKAGLTVIPHLKDCYNLYYSARVNYTGIVRKEDSNEVSLSSIPKGENPIALLYFNRDGYSAYCKRYKEYWEWVQKRNEDRYNITMLHGKNYDSKNMMHVFRLLLMAKEIAVEGRINVFRKDREFLLSIKEGVFEYQELVDKAEMLKHELTAMYQQSTLPDEPNTEAVEALLVKMRKTYYQD
jgi:uncharacterized protein